MPAQDGYEEEFVRTLMETEEVVVPYFESVTFVDAMDKTSVYILGLIDKHGLSKIGEKYTVSGGRFTPEHGHHYWVRLWDPKQAH